MTGLTGCMKRFVKKVLLLDIVEKCDIHFSRGLRGVTNIHIR